MKFILAVVLSIFLFSGASWSQSPVLQSGAVVKSHAAKWTAKGVISDAGPVTGGNPNVGISDLPLVGVGTPLCIYDSPVTNSFGYHVLCLGHTTDGSGLISIDSGGGASQGDFIFRLNGTDYSFPGNGNGNVLGPNASTSGNVASFNNSGGTLLKDSGVSLRPDAVSNGFSLAQQALFLSGTYTGTGTGPYAEFSVADTATNTTAGTSLVGLRVDHNMNAGLGAGNRAAIQGILIQNSQTSGTNNQLKFYHGVFGQVYANANDGGSATTLANSKGNFYGVASLGQLQAGATNIQGVFGSELDVSVQAGATVAEKAVLMLVGVNSDAVHGAVYDAMLGLTRDDTTSVGFNHGIAFGRPDSTWPIDTTNGTLIGIVTPGSGTAQAKYGIDLRGLTITAGGYQFVGTGFAVDPTGNVSAGAIQSSTISPQLGLYDTSVGFVGGGEVRYISLGTGAYQYQINTAIGGGFGTVTVAYSVNAAGDFILGQGLFLPGGTLLSTLGALSNGAAAQTATLTNGPTAGNPTKWIPINDNGTVRYLPAW